MIGFLAPNLRAAEPDDTGLAEKVRVLEQQVGELTERLRESNAEAEVYRKKLDELRLRDQALGIELFTGDTARIEEKLVGVVRDLRESQETRAALAKRLLELAESAELLASNAPQFGPDVLSRVTDQVRMAKEVTQKGVRVGFLQAMSLLDARVLHINSDAALVILNAGAAQGAESGMIFELIRDGRRLGSCKIIDVRERVSGALLDDPASAKTIQAGDAARVATTQR